MEKDKFLFIGSGSLSLAEAVCMLQEKNGNIIVIDNPIMVDPKPEIPPVETYKYANTADNYFKHKVKQLGTTDNIPVPVLHEGMNRAERRKQQKKK